MYGNRLAAHERLDLHELIGMMNVCAAKSATLMTMARDQELRNFLDQEMNCATKHARELQDLLGGQMGGRY
jgi:similar to spore coat protein